MHTSVLFIALETYSLIGGLQKFNQRVIKTLDELSAREEIMSSNVMLLRDSTGTLPKLKHTHVRAYGSNRIRFASDVVQSAVTKGGLLLLGHINLLPIARAAKWLRPDLKIILFVHGDEVWGDPKHRSLRWYEPRMLSAVDQIASVSNYTAKQMARAFSVDANKFILLPNAVDPIKTSTPSRSLEKPTVLAVTRLGLGDREKRIDDLVEAVSLLNKDGVHCCLEVVGDGALRPELESLARRLGLSGEVQFHGRLSDGELQEAYGRAHVFALPSTKEGFGIVYLEAWQHGIPVICSTEGASHEVITEGLDGFAISPGDIEGLSKKIRQLVEQPQYAAALGRAGFEKVQTRYLHQHFAANVADLIFAQVSSIHRS